MDFDTYQTLLFERRGRVLEITMNRPEKLNAVDEEMHAELARVFVDVSNDADSDIAVLTGAGRAFSSGGDIDWMQKMIDQPASFEKTAREGKQIVFSLLDCEKPVIAKLNGHATGLGATIALFCDVIFAAETAKIGDPHVSVGLVAGDGGALIWPQVVGYAKARKYLFTGDLIEANEAERIGLVTEVVPRLQLDARVQELAQQLAGGASRAMRWTKIATNLPLKALFHAHFDAGIAYECLSNRSADHAEAVRAFRERRKPQFNGR